MLNSEFSVLTWNSSSEISCPVYSLFTSGVSRSEQLSSYDKSCIIFSSLFFVSVLFAQQTKKVPLQRLFFSFLAQPIGVEAAL